jgi:hypothetical protein
LSQHLQLKYQYDYEVETPPTAPSFAADHKAAPQQTRVTVITLRIIHLMQMKLNKMQRSHRLHDP